MTEIFDTQDYQYASFNRKKNWWIFAALMLLLVGGNILIVMLRFQIGGGLARFLNVVFTAIVGGTILFLFKMKFRPVGKFARMLREINRGLVEKDRGKFLGFDDTVTEKEGVEFYLMIVEERVKKRPDMPERRILIPTVKPKPELNTGDVLKYETQAGILIRYEIISRAVTDGAEVGGISNN